MLFNSYVFIFAFLPVTLIGFSLLCMLGYRRLRAVWLVLCSMYFYASWSPLYLRLLLVSMGVNYLIGAVWGSRPTAPARKIGLLVALIFNLGVLAYFKYANLLISTFDSITGRRVPAASIILPLGISFFTFQKSHTWSMFTKGRATHVIFFITACSSCSFRS